MNELVKVEAERHHRRDVKVLEVPKDSAPTSPPRDEANDAWQTYAVTHTLPSFISRT
jgi:hypothetical protein